MRAYLAMLTMKRKLTENLKRIRHRIEEACVRADRNPDNVQLVAVTKYATLDVIRGLLDIGVPILGENRVQELTKRAAMIHEGLSRREPDKDAPPRPGPAWHMIGHLQRNKVKALLPWVDMIHSVDSLRLAEEIDAQAGKLDLKIPILLEVNAGGEANKRGVAVPAVTHLAEQVDSLEHIELRGLMAMAPLTDDVGLIRHTFERVRDLFDEIIGERLCSPRFGELSLGMSQDFEYGIEAGATYVRIGSALFEGIEMGALPAHVE